MFLRFNDKLQESIKPLIEKLKNSNTPLEVSKIYPGMYFPDIEAVCTILDINIERPYLPEGRGVDLRGCAMPFIEGFIASDLECARYFIHQKIVERLLPSKLNTDIELLDKSVSRIKKGDTIITFNYDLLLEQGLLRKGLWNPEDGYCLGEVEGEEKKLLANLNQSEVKILKMHGSVSWESPTLLNNNIRILLKDPYEDLPFFDEIITKKNKLKKSIHILKTDM